MNPTSSPREVAPGVFRLGTRWANFYLLVDGPEATLVDAGYPRYAGHVSDALESLDLPPHAVTAVVVTHHHVDHVGTAESVRETAGATVYVHARDAPIVRGDRRSHVPPGFYRHSWRPSMARYLAHTIAVGGARYRPVRDVQVLNDDGPLDAPGVPRVIETPGHTAGHLSVVLEDRGVLFAGDAMVNFDYASGRTGVQLHRFNEDRTRAAASLASLDSIETDVVLFGHGDPWTGGTQAAVALARASA